MAMLLVVMVEMAAVEMAELLLPWVELKIQVEAEVGLRR